MKSYDMTSQDVTSQTEKEMKGKARQGKARQGEKRKDKSTESKNISKYFRVLLSLLSTRGRSEQHVCTLSTQHLPNANRSSIKVFRNRNIRNFQGRWLTDFSL
jgi:hypothetical protein